jgi:biotin carboxylase
VGRSDGVLPALWSLRRDVTTSALAHLPTLAKEKGLLAGHLRAIGLPNDATSDEWVDAARAIAKVRPLTRAVAFEDRTMGHALAISQALGLPGHSPHTVHNVHNKALLRQRLRDAGVQDVPFAVAESPDHVVEFGERIGWPVVVKPVQGSGSYGVTLVRDSTAAKDAFRHAAAPRTQSRGGVLVEKYLTGQLFVLELFSEHGDHETVAVNEYFTEPPHMVISGFAVPHTAAADVCRAVSDHTVAALRALGVRNGPTHVEVMMTADGPRVIEAHLRTGGDDLPLHVRQVTGIDIERLWARQLLGETVLPKLRRRLAQPIPPAATALAFVTPRRQGVLRKVDGVAEAMAVPGVVLVKQLVKPGARVRELTGFDRRAVVVKADLSDPTRALAAAREGAAKLRFDVVTPQSGLAP